MFSVLAFGLFCLTCTVWAFRRHPVWGLYFYLGATFVHPPSRWWSYLVPDLRWSLLAAAVTIAAAIYHHSRGERRPAWFANTPAILLGGYATLMWLQTPIALDVSTHLVGTIQYTKYLVVFWMVYRIADSKENIRLAMLAHALGCGLLGLYCMSVGRQGDRLDGVGGPGMDDANTLGMYLATGALASFGLFLTQKGWRRWAMLVPGALAAEGFVLANSRGAFLGLVAGGLLMAFAQSRQYRRHFWAFALVALVGFAAVVDKTFIDRMFTIGDVTSESEDAEQSARSRKIIFDAQLRMAADYPFGAGFRGTATLSPSYLDERWLADDPNGGSAERSSHNTFMTTLVEQGVLGCLLYVSCFLWLLVTAWRVRKLDRLRGSDPELETMAAALCGVLMCVFVAGQAADYLLAEVQFWYYALLVGALQIVATRARSARVGAGQIGPPVRSAAS